MPREFAVAPDDMMEDMMAGSARSPGADDGEAFDEDLARAIANSLESEAPPAKRHRGPDRDMMDTDSPQGFSLGDM